MLKKRTVSAACDLNAICESILEYLQEIQDFTPGEYYGAFWSEKAYHGPLLDWNAGGAHHHRGAGSAALALWQTGKQRNNSSLCRKAELAFDWIAARQHQRGGWYEIQNNEKPSDWEKTGLEELSTISTSFAVRGLALAILEGLPPKKSYMDCLLNAGHWFLGIEAPPLSGAYPHHERSPYDTLNGTLHAVEALILIYQALSKVYNRTLNIFLTGAMRGMKHILPQQWENGCFPYRDIGDSTINYTALVVWLMLNTLDHLPEYIYGKASFPARSEFEKSISSACKFLENCVAQDGSLIWEENETSSAKYNVWTYAITYSVLERMGRPTAQLLLDKLLDMRTPDGLLPMRDRGETITRCAFMQADMLLFLIPFTNL
jgi:hypothetical protein